METFSGTNLLRVFHELGIDTGTISKNVFDAWFDTDDSSTKSFLEWLCCLNKYNVLRCQEDEEFLYLKENGLILEKTEYKQSIKQTEFEYEGIWDCEDNIFESEYLNEELSVLINEQLYQENTMKIQETLGKKLIAEINNEEGKEIELSIKQQAAQEECFQLAVCLDELHQKIYKQIYHYSESINNFQDIPAFISNIPWESYNQYCQEIPSSLGCFISKESNVNHKLESAIKTTGEFNNSSFLRISENTDELYLCFIKALQAHLVTSIEEEKLQAEINYLKNPNLNEAAALFEYDAERENVISKEEKLVNVYSQIKIFAKQVTDRFTNEGRIICIKQQLERNEKESNLLALKINKKFLDILTNQTLCSVLLYKENTFIKTIDKFFRDTAHYIVHNIQPCQKRIQTMLENIEKYKHFEELPIEKRGLLIKSAVSILSNSNKTADLPLVDSIIEFVNRQTFLSYSIFKNDSVTNTRTVGFLEKEMNLLKSFLMSSPTSHVVAIPCELLSELREVKNNLQLQRDAAMKGIEIYNKRTEVLSKNKWLMLKRQLWMLFIIEPKKVLSTIHELRKEIESGSKITVKVENLNLH